MAAYDTNDTSALRDRLVDELKSMNLIESERVEAAFREVPRHLFVPGTSLDKVYSDESVITKRDRGIPISSSSQPAMMAIMLEQLELEPGHRVLEIGAGTGYNAALMAHIVGETGRVIAMDIDEDIVAGARDHLSAAGLGDVQVVCGDGGFGYTDAAPYDRIILTVGAWDIVPAWREQLKPGGRLLLPLSIRAIYQLSVAFEQADDHLASVSIKNCGFMLLRGAFAGPERHVPLGPEQGLNLSVVDEVEIDADAVYALLTAPSSDESTDVRVTTSEGQALSLWTSLRETGVCGVWAEGAMAERTVVPGVFRESGGWKFRGAGGLLGKQGLCLFTPLPGLPTTSDTPDASEPLEMFVRSYGTDDSLSRRLIKQTIAWDRAGRPSAKIRRVRAYPIDTENTAGASESVISKRWTKLALGWQDSSMNAAADNASQGETR